LKRPYNSQYKKENNINYKFKIELKKLMNGDKSLRKNLITEMRRENNP